MKIIIFEGVDGSGKTTLKRYIDEQTNYKYIFVDRLTGSTLVYDKVTKRNNRAASILEFEEKIKDNFVMIYCECGINENMKRLKEKQEEQTEEQIVAVKTEYNKYLDTTPIPFVRINTELPIDTCCYLVVEFIKSKGG